MNESKDGNKEPIMEGNRFKFGIGSALSLFLLIIVCMQFISGLLIFPTKTLPVLTHILLPLSFLVGGGVAIFLTLKKLKIEWSVIKEHLYKPTSMAMLFLSVLLFISLLPFTEFLTSIVPTEGVPWLERLYQLLMESFDGMLDYKLAGFITVCILAPIIEEILFRGILLRGLLQKGISPILAIVLTSFLFGLAHLNPWQFLGAGFLGSIFGFVYYRTQSLWLPIFLHALNNLISFTFMLKLGTMEGNVTDVDNTQIVNISFVIALFIGWTIYKLTQNRVKWN